MYEEMQSVLNVRRTHGGNGTFAEIDSVVLFLKDIISGLFENTEKYPEINLDNYRNYKKQLEDRGIYTAQFLLENPNDLYKEIVPHFESVKKTLERDVFDKYYGKLVNDAARLRLAVNRTQSVNDLLHMDSIPDTGNAMIEYDGDDGVDSKARDRAMRWMLYQTSFFGPFTLPGEDKSLSQ